MDKTIPIITIGASFIFLCILAFLLYMSFGYPSSAQASQACLKQLQNRVAESTIPPRFVDSNTGLVPESQ